MMSDSEREAKTAEAEHWHSQLRAYERDRADAAKALIGGSVDIRASNRALAINEEYDRLRAAMRRNDLAYSWPGL